MHVYCGVEMATDQPLELGEMDLDCLGTVGVYAKKYFALRKKCEQLQQVCRREFQCLFRKLFLSCPLGDNGVFVGFLDRSQSSASTSTST